MDNLVYVGNVPANYKNRDVRAFFSSWVEADRFKLFHFARRRESGGSLCAIVALKSKEDVNEFIKDFSKKRWCSSTGEYSGTTCEIKTHFSIPQESEITGSFQTRKVKREIPINTIIELNPSPLIPQGNVGTPSRVFWKLVDECKLSSAALSNLGLSRHVRKPGYRAVPALDIESAYIPHEYEDISSDSEFGAEEWERAEALQPYDSEHVQSYPWERHDRLETRDEYVYEHPIEKTWEKGGSGLVFYTDAAIWDELKGGFDERTTDGRDVDFGTRLLHKFSWPGPPSGIGKDLNGISYTPKHAKLKRGLKKYHGIGYRMRPTISYRQEPPLKRRGVARTQMIEGSNVVDPYTESSVDM